MAYTPPIGDVTLDFSDGYELPVGDVDLSFNGAQSIFILDGSLVAQATLAGSFVPPQVLVNGSLSVTVRLGGFVSYIHTDSSLTSNATIGGIGKTWNNVFITNGSLEAIASISGAAYPQYRFNFAPVEVRRLVQVEQLRLYDVSMLMQMIPEGD